MRIYFDFVSHKPRTAVLKRMSFNETWEWQENEFQLDVGSPLDISSSLWSDLRASEDESRSLFESTPARDCMESECPLISADNQENKDQTPSALPVQRDTDSPHSKRRRMLQFSDPAISNEQMDPLFETFEDGRNSFIGRCEDLQISDPGSFWMPENEGTYSSVSENVEQGESESWLEKCFSNRELQYPPDEMNAAVDFDDQIDISEFYMLQPSEPEADMFLQEPAAKTVITAKKTPCHSTAKPTTPVVYPFALLKPCGVQGDVTLNDINQRLMMLQSRSGNLQYSKNGEPASQPVPASAFSGKAVVARTKIHTEGNGSITIMRTKG